MKRLILLLISFIVLSCNQNTKTSQAEPSETESSLKSQVPEPMDWLLGKWKRLNEEADKETFEIWEKVSAHAYSGIGFTMQKGDTISQEKMDIIQLGDKWSLYVKMPGDTEATKFEVTELKHNAFVCVNDSIDFPNEIRYWMEGDHLKAKVSNKDMVIPFEFEKIK